jgi:CAAX prenyl protease-like protein
MSEHDDRYATPAAPAAAMRGDAPMFNRAAWLRILPFAAYLLFIAVGEGLIRIGAPAGVMRWLYPVKIALVAALLALFWRRYDELKRFTLSRTAIAAALVTGVAVLILWVSLASGWMVVGSSAGYDPRVDGRIDWLLVAIRIAGAALVVPIMEELFWRSFLMRWIDNLDFQTVEPPQLSLKSFSITVLLFGFEHNLWLAGIVAGAAYSWLYMRYRNLWTPILAHAVTNGLLGLWVVQTGNWSFW